MLTADEALLVENEPIAQSVELELAETTMEVNTYPI